MSITEKIRKVFDACTVMAGVEPDFECVYMTKGIALLYLDEIDAENTELRELCRRFSEYVSHDRCEGCVVKRRCNDGEIDECWQMGEIRKLARELGVEVDG